jgi:hypothetical protein
MTNTNLTRLQVVTQQNLMQLLAASKTAYDQQTRPDQSTTHTKPDTTHDQHHAQAKNQQHKQITSNESSLHVILDRFKAIKKHMIDQRITEVDLHQLRPTTPLKFL